MSRFADGVGAASYIAALCVSEQTRGTLRDTFGACPGSRPRRVDKEKNMSVGMIVLIIVVLMLVGALPTWPHARSWGYGPSGIVGVILVIVLVIFLMGQI